MHKFNFVSPILLFVLTITLFPVQLFAAEISSGSTQLHQPAEVSADLNVMELEPSTGATTTIEASGTWNNGCVPEFDTAELSSFGGGGMVQIMATADPASVPCGQTETDWQFPVDVQFEVPGDYTIKLLITSEQLDTTEVYAQKYVWVDGHLEFTPQSPVPGEDVTLTVTGIHSNICVPEYVSHEIDNSPTTGGTIVVELVTSGWICGQALTSWSVDVEIDALESGDYTVEIYQSDQYEGEPFDRILYKTETLSVGVSAANVTDYVVYLPGIVLE